MTKKKPEIVEYKLIVKRMFASIGEELIVYEWLNNGRFYNERYYKKIIRRLDL